MASSDERLDQLDYYTLLGVDPAASVEDIKKAFRAFARKYHPDRFAGGAQDKIDRATRIYRRGSEAYQTLTDLTSRAAYDAGLAKGQLRLRSDARARRAPANKPAPASPTAKPEARPTIRSQAALAYFRKAQELMREGDIRGAWQAIKSAIQAEPGNPFLEEALTKVEVHLRGR